MIIVEGGDNVGKSTLIRQLLELDPGLRLLHRDRFNPKTEETIATSYLKALLPTDGDRYRHAHGVIDRFLASECIYGDLFRDGCRMSEGEHFTIRNILTSYDAMVVHCDPGDDAIKASWTDREQLYDRPIKIAQAYRSRLPKIFEGLEKQVYNWTIGKHYAEEHRRALIALHHLRLRQDASALKWWSAMPYGVGQLVSPRVVLVGEGPSPNAWTNIPFAHGPAGEFLAWTVKRTEDKLGRNIMPYLYLTNADKGAENNAALLREELRLLNMRQNSIIIALGKEAAALLKYVVGSLEWEPQITELPHPQYWRRFKFQDRWQYVSMLTAAITPLFPRLPRRSVSNG